VNVKKDKETKHKGQWVMIKAHNRRKARYYFDTTIANVSIILCQFCRTHIEANFGADAKSRLRLRRLPPNAINNGRLNLPPPIRKKYARKRLKRAVTEATASTTAVKKEKQKLRRSNSANVQLGLSILLNTDTHNYKLGMNNFFGFRILVHSPYHFPEVSGKGFAIPSKKEAFIAVSAQVTERY
jgi:hypothetical protein